MPYEITCPHCRRDLHIAEGNTRPSLTCPNCLALVVNPRALIRTDLPAAPMSFQMRERDSLDDDVRRDSRGGIIAAVVLGVMVLFGLIVFVASGGFQLVSASNDREVVFGMGLFVLVAIIGTIAVVANSKSKTVSVLTGVFGGLLVGAGAVILAVVLVCMGMLQTCQFGK